MAPASSMELITLGPHVAASLAKNTGRPATWMLAVYPFKAEKDDCAAVPPEQVCVWEQQDGQKWCFTIKSTGAVAGLAYLQWAGTAALATDDCAAVPSKQVCLSAKEGWE